MTIAGHLYQKILGHPFVYDTIRPLVLGGIDYSRMYASLNVSEDSVVLDLGCGTGNALEYLTTFTRYVGIDTDDVAVRAARERHGARQNVEFHAKFCESADVDTLQPTHVVLAGVLHHLDDDGAVSLLRLVGRSRALRRIGTLDIVFAPGMTWNNLLAKLDRGRYCRPADGYRELARRAGLAVRDAYLMSNRANGRGKVRYWVMMLESEASRGNER